MNKIKEIIAKFLQRNDDLVENKIEKKGFIIILVVCLLVLLIGVIAIFTLSKNSLFEKTDITQVEKVEEIIDDNTTETHKEIIKEIIIPDFSSNSKSEIENWCNKNNVKVFFSYKEDIDSEGKVVEQRPKNGEKINEGSTVNITLTTKRAIYVPNVVGATEAKAKELLSNNSLKYSLSYEYNDSYKQGTVVSSKPVANKVAAKNSTVSFIISLGKPNIKDYKGVSFTTAKDAVNELNKKGARLSVSSTSEYSSNIEAGKIISQNIVGPTSIDKTIKFVVSKGEDYSNVDFTGKNIVYVREWFSKRNFIETYIGLYSESYAKDIVIQTSPKNLNINNEVTITYSLGKFEIPDLLDKTKEEITSILSEAKNKGADIAFNFIEVNNGAFAKGKCCYYETNDKTITISISKGNLITVSDYSGQSLDNIYNSGVCSLLSCNLILDSYTTDLLSGETEIISNSYGDFVYGDTLDIHYIKGQ